jgi:signal transduction histidine kinase
MGTMRQPATQAQRTIPAALAVARRGIERSPLPMVLTNAGEHVVAFANPAACRMLGTSGTLLEGQPLHRRFDSGNMVKLLLDRVWSTQTADSWPLAQHPHPERGKVVSTMTVTPVADGDGGPCGLLVQLIERTDSETQYASLMCELKEANEKLLLATLREQGLADQASRGEAEVKSMLARESLLARASSLLGGSLDYGETLQQVARLALPKLADFCVVYTCQGHDIEDCTVAHHDPVLEQALSTLLAPRSAPFEAAYGVGRVMRSGQVELHAQLSDPSWLARALGLRDDVHLLREVGGSSLLCVPLQVRDSLLGVLALVSADAGSVYDDADVDLAEELASRASVALDNARHYRAAQVALQQRDDVLAIVSHDLRSPLNAITLSADRLLATARTAALDASWLRPADLIGKSARRMGRLIDELLELASIQARRLVLHCARNDVVQIVGDVLEMLEPSAAQKRIRLESSTAATVMHAWCDAERMARVVTNLVGNAIKFTPERGKILVTVLEVGHELEISVCDDGMGVNSENIEKLFEPYWAGRRSSGSGSGLGLYIARGIVQAHGGRIWVESEPGRGSTFHFAVPRQPLS